MSSTSISTRSSSSSKINNEIEKRRPIPINPILASSIEFDKYLSDCISNTKSTKISSISNTSNILLESSNKQNNIVKKSDKLTSKVKIQKNFDFSSPTHTYIRWFFRIWRQRARLYSNDILHKFTQLQRHCTRKIIKRYIDEWFYILISIKYFKTKVCHNMLSIWVMKIKNITKRHGLFSQIDYRVDCLKCKSAFTHLSHNVIRYRQRRMRKYKGKLVLINKYNQMIRCMFYNWLKLSDESQLKKNASQEISNRNKKIEHLLERLSIKEKSKDKESLQLIKDQRILKDHVQVKKEIPNQKQRSDSTSAKVDSNAKPKLSLGYPSIASSSSVIVDQRRKEGLERLNSVRKQTEDRHKQQRLEEEIEKKRKQDQRDIEVMEAIKMKRREEKKKLLRDMEIHQQRAEAMQRMQSKAMEHYRRTLLISYGLGPLRFNVKQRKAKEGMIKKLLDLAIKKRYYLFWRRALALIREKQRRYEKIQQMKAMSRYCYHLQHLTFSKWLQYHKNLKSKYMILQRNYQKHFLVKQVFSVWRRCYHRQMKKRHQHLYVFVIPFSHKVIQRYYFYSWKQYCREKVLEREVEYRAAKTWQKVKNWM